MALSDYQLKLAIWDNEAVVVAVGATTARSAQLTPGIYYLTSDVALHYRQGGATVDATASSNYLPAGGVAEIKVIAGKDYVSVIQHAAATGNAYLNHPSAG